MLTDFIGLELQDEVEENWTPLDCFVILKYLNEDGVMSYFFTSTESLTDMESLGLLRAATMFQEEAISERWRDSNDETE